MAEEFQVPHRFLPFFSASTRGTAARAAGTSQLTELLFFRSAYAATIVENERRRFTPTFLVKADGSLAEARCSCAERLLPRDLCRHILFTLSKISTADDVVGDRFETSYWSDIAKALGESWPDRSLVQESEAGKFLASASGLPVIVIDSSTDDPAGALRARQVVATSPREQLLRKMTMTAQEIELAKRGHRTRRQEWEDSFWYRFARFGFERFGDRDLCLERADQGFVLRAADSHITLRAMLTPAAVEIVLSRLPWAAESGGFAVCPMSVEPSFAVSIDDNHALVFDPVVVTPHGDLRVRDLRSFGRFLLLDETKAFVSTAAVDPFFAERRHGQQTLFSVDAAPTATGFPLDRTTTIPESDVFRFIEVHREELRRIPSRLLPDAIRDPKVIRDIAEVELRFGRTEEDIEVAIDYIAGGERFSFRDVLLCRSAGAKVMNRGVMWLDVTDGQFSWMDALAPDRVIADEQPRVRLTRLDYVRMRSQLRCPVTASGDEVSLRFFRQFEELQGASDAPSPSELGMDLYGYQQTGYQWLWFLQQNGFGGLLCDDMGLGKTHQAMALIRAMSEIAPHRAYLVVAPTSLLDHWREKLARYAPSLKVAVHHGANRVLREADVVITSYTTLRNDIDEFAARWFDIVILDEMQTMKNRATATHQALVRLQRRLAIGLTGTPIENELGELKTLLDFVVPGYLPGEAAFERHFVAPIGGRNDVRARERLYALIRPFVLRRTKSQVLTDLPEKIVDRRFCELLPEQRDVYRAIITSRAAPLRDKLRRGDSGMHFHVFAALNYLKQVCDHPAMIPEYRDYSGSSGKWQLFCELLDEALSSGLKVVVFSQYVRMLAIIEAHLSERQIGFATIKGDTRDRGEMIRRFHTDSDCRVFTASLRAGGLGIDLTPASVVIHYDRWWNQAREDQATDRVHRLGQNRGVQVLKLITRGTLEEKIDRIIESKGRLANGVVKEDDAAVIKNLSPAQLEELLAWDE